MASTSSARARHGLSLVEVLISIGVLGTGLLGVAMLLPLAHHLAREGVQKDRQAIAGKRAYREFRIRGMANPLNWRSVSGERINPFILPLNPNVPLAAQPQPPRMAYCLDPLTVSETAGQQSIYEFPHLHVEFRGIALNMQRITLSSQVDPRIPMKSAHAQRVFTIEDDVVFDIPDRDDLPPQQRWLTSDAGAPDLRLANGQFSWFATLVPLSDRSSDDFRLSVVITSERLPAEAWQREMVGNVDFIGGGFAGGDVRLKFDVSKLQTANGQPIDDERFEFKPGMWLMLAQLRQQLDPTTGTNIPLREYGWYRIIATNRPLADASGGMGQEVTLHGADWNATLPTKAFYIPGVTTVYEKTIKLETSAIWN